MNGWILYKNNKQQLSELDYGTNRLVAASKIKGISLEVHRPDEFELLVNKEKNILYRQSPMPLPDLILPRLGAETAYFALALIRQFESLGVRTCNNSNSIAMAKDKLYMSQLLAQTQLPTPKTMLVKFPISVELVKRELGFPVVIKRGSGVKGVGIHLCESPSNFKDIMEILSSYNSHPNHLILQEFVKESYGKDLRVFVLGGKIIGCMKRSSKDSFKANYSLGGNVEPFPVSSEIERLSLSAARLFGLEIAGIDLLFNKNGYTICEANSSPGFKGMEQAMGTDIAGQILDYLLQKS